MGFEPANHGLKFNRTTTKVSPIFAATFLVRYRRRRRRRIKKQQKKLARNKFPNFFLRFRLFSSLLETPKLQKTTKLSSTRCQPLYICRRAQDASDRRRVLRTYASSASHRMRQRRRCRRRRRCVAWRGVGGLGIWKIAILPVR